MDLFSFALAIGIRNVQHKEVVFCSGIGFIIVAVSVADKTVGVGLKSAKCAHAASLLVSIDQLAGAIHAAVKHRKSCC